MTSHLSSHTIWFEKEFLLAQNPEINFLYYMDICIPYTLSEEQIKIGFIGPYSAAFAEKGSQLTFEGCRDAFKSLLDAFPGRSVVVRCPVLRHFPLEGLINLKALDSLGFEIKYLDVNSTISLEGDFRSRYNRNRNRELKKAVFHEMNVLQGFPDLTYDIVARNRVRKKVPISISLDKLKKNLELFPRAFETNICSYRNDVLAGSISLQVNSELTYVHMWGHDSSNALGGIALFCLADTLFWRNQNRGARQVCLGVSSDMGVIDEGLFGFKKSLGALSDYRYTLEYDG